MDYEVLSKSMYIYILPIIYDNEQNCKISSSYIFIQEKTISEIGMSDEDSYLNSYSISSIFLMSF